jgi:hypothetical protein
MHDLEKMLVKLLEDARKLPPGQKRHELFKEIGRFRVELDALKKRKKTTTIEVRPPQLAASFISSRPSFESRTIVRFPPMRTVSWVHPARPFVRAIVLSALRRPSVSADED